MTARRHLRVSRTPPTAFEERFFNFDHSLRAESKKSDSNPEGVRQAGTPVGRGAVTLSRTHEVLLRLRAVPNGRARMAGQPEVYAHASGCAQSARGVYLAWSRTNLWLAKSLRSSQPPTTSHLRIHL